MNINLPIFSLVSLLLVWFVSSCASTAPPPQDQYYRLTQLDVDQRHEMPPIEGTLKVERVRSFSVFRERAVLYTYADSPELIKQHHYHHWIDSAPALIQQQIISYLRDSNIAELVVDERYTEQSNYQLFLELNNFERVLQESGAIKVSVGITVELLNANRAQPILVKHLSTEKNTFDTSVPASVKAMNDGLLDLYQQLSENLVALGSLQ